MVTVIENLEQQLAERRERDTQWIAAGDLTVDIEYQRRLDPQRAKQIASVWDDRACGTLSVNLRDTGVLAVVDGQHRLQAFLARHDARDHLPCTLYYGLNQAEEAALFSAINGRLRRQPSRLDTLKARIVAEDPVALALVKVVNEVGLGINWNGNSTNAPHEIVAVSALEQVIEMSGVGALRETLTLMRDTWNHERRAYVGPMIMGVYHFLTCYRREYARSTFVDKLGGVTPTMLLGRAKTLREGINGNMAGAMTHAMRTSYNRGMRTRGFVRCSRAIDAD